MKKIFYIIPILFTLGCKTKPILEKPKEIEIEKVSTGITKLDITALEVNKKDKAYELGNRILMTCNTSRFKPFNEEEATESVIKNTTQERLTKTCLKFKLKYGKFIDLELIEAYKIANENITIYRYKAYYEKKIANKELRITMNDQDQVSAIQSLDWQPVFVN